MIIAESLDMDASIRLMRKICKKYDIKLTIDRAVQNLLDVNGGLAAGDNEIRLFPFRCPNASERRLVTFFHELAHCLFFANPGLTKMQQELGFSVHGIDFARIQFGVVFSNDAVEWLLEQNFSYKHFEEREVRR